MSAARPVRRADDWPRRVMPEILDAIPADDPRAVRSRRDLRIINCIMGASSALLRALDAVPPTPALQLVELGSGDGTMMLRLARSRARRWPNASVVLLDKEPAVNSDTLAAIRDLGWSVEIIGADVLDWLSQPAGSSQAVIFANLFVHHFAGEQLARLLAGIATHTRFFACCEPRRCLTALAGSRLLGLIGCNDVTRHDAVVSVHAGFRDQELASVWPKDRSGTWRLEESAAGAFKHVFVAVRDQ